MKDNQSYTEALQYDDLPQKIKYRQYLLEQIQKMDKEIEYTLKTQNK